MTLKFLFLLSIYIIEACRIIVLSSSIFKNKKFKYVHTFCSQEINVTEFPGILMLSTTVFLSYFSKFEGKCNKNAAV